MPALFTVAQSRWALHILVVILSAVAIASSAPAAAGGVSMYSGQPGDLRGLSVVGGSTGLMGITVLRLAALVLPRPWQLYVDRIEYSFVAMLWVLWTSSTMAFSAFTVKSGVCNQELSSVYLPACPLLTFDLVLLHLLSIATLALLLVIMSSTLSPNYYLSLSSSAEDQAAASKLHPEGSDVLVMWDMALSSPPPSPGLRPSRSLVGAYKTYGTQDTGPRTSSSATAYSQPGSSEVQSVEDPEVLAPPALPKRRDKFASGRAWSYIPLLLCSLGTIVAASIVLDSSEYIFNSICILLVAIATLFFCLGYLLKDYMHKKDSGKSALDPNFVRRHQRGIEVAIAGALFLLWPLAAIVYTLFPPTPNRPCANPAVAVAPIHQLPNARETSYLCLSTATAITLSWLAAWVLLGRLIGLVVPTPEVDTVPPVASSLDRSEASGEESRSLLRSKPAKPAQPVRPKMGWGRLVAGEAFELGEDEDG